MAGREGFAPPGWPDGVPGPGAPGWEDALTRWLLDHAPADWRTTGALRRHRLALAWLTREHLRAQLAAARQVWVDLADADAGPEEESLIREALTGTGPPLAASVRAAELAYEALQGERFIPRL